MIIKDLTDYIAHTSIYVSTQAFSHWILCSQTLMRADLPRVHTRLGVSSSS